MTDASKLSATLLPLLLVLHAGDAAAQNAVALENDYVRVTRDVAACAATGPACGDRIVVAMGNIELAGRKMKRGDVAVFKPTDSYALPSGGPFYEIAIKPNHPPVKSPAEMIAPDKNAMVYEGETFFVYEERLAVGDTRPRHSHSQRVEVRINQGPVVWQMVEGRDQPIEPPMVNFREAMIHTTRNTGDAPLFNIIMEFRPEKGGAR
jgi:hypothetical protein